MNAFDSNEMRAMTDSNKTLDEILNLAAAQFKVPREKLTPDDDFFKTLGIDSLQALDLLTRLEHHFNVELPDYELQGVSDFRTLAGGSRRDCKSRGRIGLRGQVERPGNMKTRLSDCSSRFPVLSLSVVSVVK